MTAGPFLKCNFRHAIEAPLPNILSVPNRCGAFERQRLLLSLLDSEPDMPGLTSAFLRPPLRSTEYGRAFGTLYTVVYRPNDGVADYLWPDDSWRRTFDSVDATKTVILREP